MRDCIVVGAGPAGMAAATLLAERGADVVVLDEQASPGGQIWRGVERAPSALRAVLGEEYAAGAEAVARFRASGAGYRPGAAVWNVTAGREVWVGGGMLEARCVLLAVGAMERAVPVPGWTLPGVMGAGGVQILLKSAGLVPQGVVLAGNGPLLFLLAAQLIAAGAPPVAVLDTARAEDLGPALRQLRVAAWPYLRKGLMLQGAIRAAGVAWFRGVSGLEVLGRGRAEGVRFVAGGQVREIAASVVALHEGVIPAQHAARAVGCEHVWDEGQACFRPVLDAWGNASVEGVLVAGDAGGIGGAAAAVHAGRIAAAEVLRRLGRVDAAGRDRLAAADRRAVAHGAQGPNQAKAFTRAGMGACQGRMCGTTVATVMAGALGRSPGEVGHSRVRPPLKPVTVGELAEVKEESSFF